MLFHVTAVFASVNVALSIQTMAIYFIILMSFQELMLGQIDALVQLSNTNLQSRNSVVLLMVKHILYPTDLGLYGTYVLQNVMELAEHYDANITVIHAVEPLGVFADAVLETYVPSDMMGELKDYGMPAVMEAIRQQVVEAFEDEMMDCSADVNRISDVQVLRGNPAEIILDQCKKIQADMIVMGSHCTDSDNKCLLGSTVSKVLQLAQVPVCMIPIAFTQKSAKRMASLPISRI